MPQPPPSKTWSERAIELARRLDMSVLVLFAALAFDLVFVTQRILGTQYPRYTDFGIFPAIFAMAACAFWARQRAAVAGMIGALALMMFTFFIRYYDISAYSSVLANLSVTEVVAGVEMVYLLARRARPGVAFSVISALVVAALTAVFGRDVYRNLSGTGVVQSLLFGVLLLGGAVVAGVVGRPRQERKPQNEERLQTMRRINDLVRGQWPLIALLAFTLLVEFSYTYSAGYRSFVALLLSAASAVVAAASPRRPKDAILVVAGIMLLSAFATPFLYLGHNYQFLGGVPATQVVAGFGVVVNIVRAMPIARAWPRIAVLSGVVAVTATLNFGLYRSGRLIANASTLAMLAVLASLLLGIAIAIGLYLRSRDSERAQVVKSAVTDAQTAERMALARELHDVVAHHVTGIVVQAQAARMMGEKNPTLALESMERIEDAGVEALAAMRRLVRSMRGDAQAGAGEFNEQATTDLAADLRRLVEAGNHGVPTKLDLNLPPNLPHEVGRSALRLIQESLTNVGKHAADATEAVVIAEADDRELHLRVTDNGREQTHRPAGGSGGYGLVGMRERVALLHGRLSAGREPGGGWRVEAWLPLEANGETDR
ncbi:sensor histidine kinase [Amycolatopsis benzoatilytica]|uniref:sensor histidine kinase n=1 Tax=Amycolatopsis benzoatilytica TaxID=346045 RepID=UPI000362F59E|nr:histidine kinase [Amycolatopsis benzoatilytica]